MDGYTNQSEYIVSKISASLLIGGGKASTRGDLGGDSTCAQVSDLFYILSVTLFPTSTDLPHIEDTRVSLNEGHSFH